MFLQIEALFDLIKGLIKDMDGAQDDEVRPTFCSTHAIFFPLLSAVNIVKLTEHGTFQFHFLIKLALPFFFFWFSLMKRTLRRNRIP